MCFWLVEDTYRETPLHLNPQGRLMAGSYVWCVEAYELTRQSVRKGRSTDKPPRNANVVLYVNAVDVLPKAKRTERDEVQ